MKTRQVLLSTTVVTASGDRIPYELKDGICGLANEIKAALLFYCQTDVRDARLAGRWQEQKCFRWKDLIGHLDIHTE